MVESTSGTEDEGLSAPPDKDLSPPNPPWKSLSCRRPLTGYLSFYHSDSLSVHPARAVTRIVGKKYDNKSDPNIETGTFGLFSTCEPGMRAGVVRNGRPYLFFVTTVEGRRVLSGYYRIKWWTIGHTIAAYRRGKSQPADFMLAASKVHFIDPPLDLQGLAEKTADPAIAGWFRTYKGIDSIQTKKLLRILDSRPDKTAELIAEVRRLERLNLRFSRYRYPGWEGRASLDWKEARKWLAPRAPRTAGIAVPLVNKKAIKYWTCLECHHRVDNLAPLKLCPRCGKVGTLIGVSGE